MTASPGPLLADIGRSMAFMMAAAMPKAARAAEGVPVSPDFRIIAIDIIFHTVREERLGEMEVHVTRRGPIHPAIEEALISALVHAFYQRVRQDPLLGPVFDRVIGDRWDEHLAKLCDFWSSVMMMSGRYKGTPFQAHQRIAGLNERHFDRWLALWRETAVAVCSPEVAELFVARAERIAASLKLGIRRIDLQRSGAAH